jgi:hypothetical protein
VAHRVAASRTDFFLENLKAETRPNIGRLLRPLASRSRTAIRSVPKLTGRKVGISQLTIPLFGGGFLVIRKWLSRLWKASDHRTPQLGISVALGQATLGIELEEGQEEP